MILSERGAAHARLAAGENVAAVRPGGERRERFESWGEGNDVMTAILVNKPVCLTDNLPDLGLYRGCVGTVCSTWAVAETTYEVEFRTPGHAVRVLLRRRQLVPEPVRRAVD